MPYCRGAMSVPPPPPRRRDAPGTSSTPLPPRVDPVARQARRSVDANGPNGGGNGGNSRLWLIIGGVVVVVLIGAAAALALGGGGKSEKKQAPAATSVDLKPGETAVFSVAAPAPNPSEFPADLQSQIMKTVGSYVDDGMTAPLRSGKPADDTKLHAIFDDAAFARLGAGDRASLLDEGLPAATGNIDVKAVPVRMALLSQADGKVMVVTAVIDLTISSQTDKGIDKIHRTGQLDFAQQITGEWKITGWTIHVDRSGPGVPKVEATTTTTGAAT